MPFSTVCSLLRVPYEDLASALTEDVLTARGRRKITNYGIRPYLTHVHTGWYKHDSAGESVYANGQYNICRNEF